jgi:acetyl esterase/lipase
LNASPAPCRDGARDRRGHEQGRRPWQQTQPGAKGAEAECDLQELRQQEQHAKAEQGDFVYLHLSGHGAQQPQLPSIPDDVIWEPAIEYAIAGAMPVNLMMDVVRPRKQSGLLPAVVCIHGGGFRAGNRESYLPLCIRLAQHGYVAATVSYRLSPRDQFPAPVHDVKAAVRWLRANAARFGR